MVEEALIYDNINVIVVDWVSGKFYTDERCGKYNLHSISGNIIKIGSGPPYTQAVANIRLIGVMLAHLILSLHVGLHGIVFFNCFISHFDSIIRYNLKSLWKIAI